MWNGLALQEEEEVSIPAVSLVGVEAAGELQIHK
jgi:hypothetical protein